MTPVTFTCRQSRPRWSKHAEPFARTDRQPSFRAFTYPHQLMRRLLLEQVCRAFRIMKGEPYHKQDI